MLSPRQRPLLFAAAALVLIWVAVIAGFKIAQAAKVTPDKVRAYTASLDFSKLSGAERAAAIQKLAAMLNGLSLDERQSLQLDRTAYRWFEQMTEEEKAQFLEATMPTGFKQMISAFEQLPQDRQRRTIDQALKQIRDDREKMAAGGQFPRQNGTNQIVLSDELREKVTKIGLKTFYSQSSAQTKAEMAPLLEEMQKMMESGRLMRGPRQ
jgi:hypothetical protein